MNAARRVSAAGFSLIELLVAMTLGLLLSSGMLLVLSGNRRTGELAELMIDLQENARYALSLIASDVRMSGYQGCMDPNNGEITIIADGAPTTALRSSATTGSVIHAADDWRPSPPGLVPPPARPAAIGTHALTLQYGDPRSTALRAQMSIGVFPSRSAALPAEDALGFAVGDFAIVANCEVGDLFRVSGVSIDGRDIEHAASHNASASLTRAYGDARTRGHTQLTRFVSHTWFVADTDDVDASGTPIRALYRQALPYDDPEGNPPMEIVRHVHDLRTSFGLRAADGSLRYVAPDDPSFDAERVEIVRLGILMTSAIEAAVEIGTSTYLVAGQRIEPSDGGNDADTYPPDRRVRLAFNTVAKVRNRRDD